ncbi:MAG TPA: hypothetical protein VIM70_05235 [Clostridium sp.]|uniref:hypothetical protein n=1 Tax=Clostridium sp. TaxID=1506 RepID=UPI002F9502BC
MKISIEGTPYEVKVSSTVWMRGKVGDNIKNLPIHIVGGQQGSGSAKKVFISSTLAFIIIKGANALATSLGSKINF